QDDRLDNSDRGAQDAAGEGSNRNRPPDDGAHGGVHAALDAVRCDRLPEADLVDVVHRNKDVVQKTQHAENDRRDADQRQRRRQGDESAEEDGQPQSHPQPEGSRQPGGEEGADQPTTLLIPKMMPTTAADRWRSRYAKTRKTAPKIMFEPRLVVAVHPAIRHRMGLLKTTSMPSRISGMKPVAPDAVLGDRKSVV